MMEAHWEHFPHGADMGVRGVGATKEEAFEQAAVALTAIITDPKSVKSETSQDLDRIEKKGCMKGTRPDQVSEQAKKRQQTEGGAIGAVGVCQRLDRLLLHACCWTD